MRQALDDHPDGKRKWENRIILRRKLKKSTQNEEYVGCVD